MASYDLEEQDQLEELKAWWARWGGVIATALVIGALVVIGIQGWRWWTNKRAADASVLYSAVSEAARTKNSAKAKDAIAATHRPFRRNRLCAARRAAVREDALRRRRPQRRGRAACVGGRPRDRGRAQGDRPLPARRDPDRREAVRRRAGHARRQAPRGIRGLVRRPARRRAGRGRTQRQTRAAPTRRHWPRSIRSPSTAPTSR